MRNISGSARKARPDPTFAGIDVQCKIPIPRQFQLLSVGGDAVLLGTRTSILRHAGFIVEQAATPAAALRRFIDGDFDMVVICHSFPPNERNGLIDLIHERKPSTLVIFVSDEEEDVDVDATVQGLDGPETLLQTIVTLLQVARKPPRAAGTA